MKYFNQSISIKPCFTPVQRSMGFYSMIAALCFTSLTSHGQTDSQGFLVGIAPDKTITIQANNASLKDILLDIEAKTGIRVNFVADTTQRVSVNIENQTIENAIGKLTPNYMIMRDLKDGQETISEIIIISDDPAITSSGDGSTFLPSGQPAPVIIEEGSAEPNTAPTNEPVENQEGSEPQNAQPAPTN